MTEPSQTAADAPAADAPSSTAPLPVLGAEIDVLLVEGSLGAEVGTWD